MWNAARFVLPHVEGAKGELGDPAKLGVPERWILSRLTATEKEVTAHLEATRLNEAAYGVYDFLWHSYCDWYLEIVKPALLGDEGPGEAREVLLHVLRSAIRMLSPFMPHLAEEIGSYLRLGAPCVSAAPWPGGEGGFRDDGAEREMAVIQDVVTAVRTLRSEVNVPPKEEVRVVVRFLDDKARPAAERNAAMIRRLARIGDLDLAASDGRPKGSLSQVTRAVEVFLPLEGLVDMEKERQRIAKEEERLARELERLARKLMNREYIAKAPAEVVEKDRDRERRFTEMLGRVRRNLAALSG
ncbi:MAG: class I tRNA ligase family protein [Candidatus Eisenbacteria bacterium]